MGEGILIYGMATRRSRYTRDLQSFADKVLARSKPNGSLYVFGKTNKAVLLDLARRGVTVMSDKTAIADRTIMKYKDHPKREKGAVVSFNRFVMVEKAVKYPKNVYIDTKRSRLVYVSSVKYSKDKVLKVIIEPNQKFGKKYYNKVVSIGVVDKVDMRGKQYKKIK